jgi:PAS domain S-box-containing protein
MHEPFLPHRRVDPDPAILLAPEFVAALLDHMPQALFWLKDGALRYVSVNNAMLDLCGVRTRDEMIGKTARDFFPEVERELQERQDLATIQGSGLNMAELRLCQRLRGEPVWLLIRRTPIVGANGGSTGLAATATRLDTARHAIHERLAFVLRHIHDHFSGPVDISALARRCDTSISQLNRSFSSLMGQPPKRYLMHVRFEAAVRMLRSRMSIVEVAYACGYPDQGAFARLFRDHFGVSPSAYRQTQTSRDIC